MTRAVALRSLSIAALLVGMTAAGCTSSFGATTATTLTPIESTKQACTHLAAGLTAHRDGATSTSAREFDSALGYAATANPAVRDTAAELSGSIGNESAVIAATVKMGAACETSGYPV